MMDREVKQSLVISLFVHAGFVFFALLFVFLETWLEEPEPVVFELVAASAPAQVRERPAELPEEAPLEPLEVEEPDPIEPPPELPDLPEPEPEPPPAPEPVQTLSFEEWARNRDLPERVQRVQRERTRTPENVPEIETDVRSRLERQLSPIRIEGVDLSDIDTSDALQRYLAALRQRIQSAFQPSGSSLEAEAYFTVSADGRLSNPRINRSSGNPAFDQSVLRTLRTARAPGPPPGNRDYTFSLVFRSE